MLAAVQMLNRMREPSREKREELCSTSMEVERFLAALREAMKECQDPEIRAMMNTLPLIIKPPHVDTIVKLMRTTLSHYDASGISAGE